MQSVEHDCLRDLMKYQHFTQTQEKTVFLVRKYWYIVTYASKRSYITIFLPFRPFHHACSLISAFPFFPFLSLHPSIPPWSLPFTYPPFHTLHPFFLSPIHPPIILFLSLMFLNLLSPPQPSSSGRTADLLGGVTGLVGFSALQDLGYVPAASQCLGADESAMAASFRVALRKMMKKDATTKIKVREGTDFRCLLPSISWMDQSYNNISTNKLFPSLFL